MTEPTREQRMHRLLRAVEWNGVIAVYSRDKHGPSLVNCCSWCDAHGPQGIEDVDKTFPHAPDCELSAMIAELEREIIPIPLGSTP